MSTFTIISWDDNKYHECIEEPVADKDIQGNIYNKFVRKSDGCVPILISNYGWSTMSPEFRKQLLVDSRIVRYVATSGINRLKDAYDFFKKLGFNINPDLYDCFNDNYHYININGLRDIQIKFIPSDTLFRIDHIDLDYSEKIVLYDSDTYMRV